MRANDRHTPAPQPTANTSTRWRRQAGNKRGWIIAYPEQERAAGNEWLALAVEARGMERFGVRKG